ncbi:MAG: hypothetical protein AMXMBFR4_10770 [Candidatus Hydrogenedentota bacterium]
MRTDLTLHFWISFAIGLFRPGIAFLAGLGKEIWDAVSGTGVASAEDLAADLLGILAASILTPFF